MAKRVFGTYPDVLSTATSYDQDGWLMYHRNYAGFSGITLEPGDFIRCNGHTAIVWKVENENVYVAECWGGVNCKIHWGTFSCGCLGVTTQTESQLKAHVNYIIKAPKTNLPTTYTITFDTNGATGTMAPVTVGANESYTLSQIPFNGSYVFMGWSLSSDADSVDYERNSQISPNSNITLYAVWGVYVNFKNAQNETFDRQAVIPNVQTSLEAVEIENFDIAGWATEPGSQNIAYGYGGLINTSSTLTLYAIQTYTVSFNANGGIPARESDTFYYGEPPVSFPYAEKTGYKFTGWCDSEGVRIKPASIDPTAGHITLYANWQEGNKIYFVTNGGEGEAQTRYVKYNEEFGTLPYMTKEGYKFDGWWFTHPETKISVRVTANTLMPVDYDIYLWANWVQGAKISFLCVGGECEEDYRYVASGDIIGELPIPQKEGYVFDGWYLSDDYSGNAITSSYVVPSNINFALFAKWTEE